MTYSVKEIYYTLQGEGAHTGRPAVFLRFAGCNLWSGREEHRSSAVCRFCDTEFVGVDGPNGGKFASADALVQAVERQWPVNEAGKRFVVCTGGEPLLQLDGELTSALHGAGFFVAVETNGTVLPPDGVDWLCVSPKGSAEVVVEAGEELKLVYPQREREAQPERFEHLAFEHFFLQPLDSPERDANTQAAIRYCMQHPQWKLSVQTHKFLGID